MDAQVSTDTDNKNKRSHSEVSSPTCSTPTETIPTEFTKPKPVQIKKKKKIIKLDKSTSETTNIESILQPVKQFIQDASPPYVLNYTQLLAFLEDVHGSSTPVELALEYTQDIHGLGHMLTEIYTMLNERAIKSRITRIKKKLL
uniref:Uncharacterized protein LOC114347242 n=1 Tax=Diabrotica virgifera virgifera TaxID=50390 RepID=A0A6P7GW85_DIAVI